MTHQLNCNPLTLIEVENSESFSFKWCNIYSFCYWNLMWPRDENLNSMNCHCQWFDAKFIQTMTELYKETNTESQSNKIVSAPLDSIVFLFLSTYFPSLFLSAFYGVSVQWMWSNSWHNGNYFLLRPHKRRWSTFGWKNRWKSFTILWLRIFREYSIILKFVIRELWSTQKTKVNWTRFFLVTLTKDSAKKKLSWLHPKFMNFQMMKIE